MSLDQLTEAQRRAAISLRPAIVVAAGPGSGKTRTVVERVRFLTEISPPAEIACLTFTNAAARELEERLSSAEAAARDNDSSCEKPETKLGYCGTLHGFALRMLRDHGMRLGLGARLSVVSADSAAMLLEAKARELDSRSPITRILEAKARAVEQSVAHVPKTHDEIVVQAYRADLRRGGTIDFDFLLSEFLVALSDEIFRSELRSRFTHLIVDEVQDGARIDWAIYRALPIATKFFVGDPDQAIYSFRGGSVEQMLGFVADRSDRVALLTLDENFRSRLDVIERANDLISKNEKRFKRRLVATREGGGSVRAIGPLGNEGEELAVLGRLLKALPQGQSAAVLARTNELAAAAQRSLAAWDLPVVKKEPERLPPDHRFMTALAQLLVNPDCDALARVFLVEEAAKREGCKIRPYPKRYSDDANSAQRAARILGISINASLWGHQPGTLAADFPELLRSRGCSAEAAMFASERARELPEGASMLDLAGSLVPEPVARDGGASPGMIECLTIHAAKGREFDHVFVIGFEDEVTPGRRKTVDVEEERRLAFVALTRAKETATFLCAASRKTPWGAIVDHSPSRFLRDMGVTWEQPPATQA